ncbi:MAG TPA: biotin/lipoyl-containing protein [Bacteroidales bacterium]|nr:biotin/lipoyl-containing protein [Bacteroidales bacterium]
MRKFLIKVNNQQFEVELEEIKSNRQPEKPAEKVTKPAPTSNGASNLGAGSGSQASANGEKIVSPMPGNIVKVNVNKGDSVKKGQVLLVLEAMKMENEITAPVDGKVTDIQVEKGQCISAGDLMIVIG